MFVQPRADLEALRAAGSRSAVGSRPAGPGARAGAGAGEPACRSRSAIHPNRWSRPRTSAGRVRRPSSSRAPSRRNRSPKSRSPARCRRPTWYPACAGDVAPRAGGAWRGAAQPAALRAERDVQQPAGWSGHAGREHPVRHQGRRVRAVAPAVRGARSPRVVHPDGRVHDARPRGDPVQHPQERSRSPMSRSCSRRASSRSTSPPTTRSSAPAPSIPCPTSTRLNRPFSRSRSITTNNLRGRHESRTPTLMGGPG